MCEPTTIMAGLAISQMAVQGISGVSQANAQRQAGKTNAAIAEQNARLAEQQSRDALTLGAREQQQSAWKSRALRGQQQVALAANGIDAGVGSASDIFSEGAMFGEADRQAIALDAARRAWGHQTDAVNLRNGGQMEKWQGEMGARTTLLGTMTGMVGTAAGAYQSGAFKRAPAGKPSLSQVSIAPYPRFGIT